MPGKEKSKYAMAKKVIHAKKQSILKRPKRAVKKRAPSTKAPLKKKHPSLLGKMKGTVVYESDLISPIEETWDVETDQE